MPVAYKERKLSDNEKRELVEKGFTNEDLEDVSIATATPYGRKRLNEGMKNITEALYNDYVESQARKGSLPSDWRNRIIRQ